MPSHRRRTRLAARLLPCLALAALAATPPPPASAERQSIPGPLSTQRDVDVAVNARGDAVMVWRTRSGAVQVSFSPAGRRFGRPRRVPGAQAGGVGSAVRAAIDGGGDAVIAFEGTDAFVRAFVRQRSGRLTRVRTLTTRDEGGSLSGVAAVDGRMAVAYASGTDSPSRVVLGRRSGRFSSRAVLPAGVEILHLSLSPRRLITFGERPRPGGARDFLRIRHDGTRPALVRTRPLFDGASFTDLGPLAGNARGDVLARVLDSENRAQVVSSRAGKLLGDHRIPVGGDDAVALAASGRGVAATASGFGPKVRVLLRRRDGRIGPVRRYRVAPEVAAVHAAAVNDAGRYVIACGWQDRFAPDALTVLMDGRVRTIWPRTGGAYIRDPVHIDARGRVLVVFITGRRIQAWRGRA